MKEKGRDHMPMLTEQKQNLQTQAGEELSAKEIIAALRSLEQQLRDNEQLFNLTLDSDLLEACIYDGKALRSRYRYYHNMARRLGIRCQ